MFVGLGSCLGLVLWGGFALLLCYFLGFGLMDLGDLLVYLGCLLFGNALC